VENERFKKGLKMNERSQSGRGGGTIGSELVYVRHMMTKTHVTTKTLPFVCMPSWLSWEKKIEGNEQ